MLSKRKALFMHFNWIKIIKSNFYYKLVMDKYKFNNQINNK